MKAHCALLFFLILGRQLWADTLTLTDGTSLSGTIAMETPTKLAIKLSNGTIRIVSRQEVAAIERDASAGGGVSVTSSAPAKPATFSSMDAPDVVRYTIKVTATVRRPDLFKPWDRQPPKEEVGTGYLSLGHKNSKNGSTGVDEVITAASLVAYATEIRLQASGSNETVAGRIKNIYPNLGFAELQTDTPIVGAGEPDNPFSRLMPGRAPEVGDWLKLYGFTKDAGSVSTEDAAITHIDYEPATGPEGQTRHWLNSTLRDGFVGAVAAYESYPVGIVIGSTSRPFVIQWDILRSIAMFGPSGRETNKPYLSQHFQSARNPALRDYLHLPPDAHGMLVETPVAGPGGSKFQEWDLATMIGEDPIDDDGTVKREDGLRISYAYRVWTIQNDGPVHLLVRDGHAVQVPYDHPRVRGAIPITVRRRGQSVDLQVPLVRSRPLLLPDLGNGFPPYFIYGPLVFSVATRQLVAQVSALPGLVAALAFRGSPLLGRFDDEQSSPGEELVIVSSPFFPHPLAKGYGDPSLCVVAKVNGTAIHNLRHLVEVLRDSKDEFVDIEFGDRLAEELVFPRAEMAAATDSILADNDVRNQATPELMALWKLPPGTPTPFQAGHPNVR